MELLDAILRGDEAAATAGFAAWDIERPPVAYANLRRILADVTPPEFGELFGVLNEILPSSPDPDRVLNSLERWRRVTVGAQRPTAMARDRPWLLQLILGLFGLSRFLSDVLIRHPNYAAWLGNPETLEEEITLDGLERSLAGTIEASRDPDDRHRAAVRWLRRRLVQSVARVHAGATDESAFMRELSFQAIALVRVALAEARRSLQRRFGKPMEEDEDGATSRREATFAIIAMGKLGALELNFSSDIDLIFVYSAEGRTTGVRRDGGSRTEGVLTNHDFFRRLCEQIIRFLTAPTDEGYLYRTDARLRPDGNEGPLARSIDSFEIYHESVARPWERMALLRARAIAGDEKFQGAFERLAEALVYDRRLTPDLIGQIRAMKDKIDATVELGDRTDREIKRGRGGIREIEFLIHAHQLLHGARNRQLRTRSTRKALDALRDGRHFDAETAGELWEDYISLRRIENRLQIFDLRQTHTLPDDPAALDALARRCGFRAASGAGPGQLLMARWREISGRVHARYQAFFGADEDEEASGPKAKPAERAARLILAGAPEKDIIAALDPLGLESPDLIRGFERLGGIGRSVNLTASAQDLYAGLLPDLIESAAASARPQKALAQLESFIAASGSHAAVYAIFRANPKLLDLLMKAFGAADLWSHTLVAHPEYIDYLLDPEFVAATPTCGELMERLGQWTRQSKNLDENESFRAGLARLKRFETTMAGLAEIAGLGTFDEITARLSTVAETLIEAVLRRAASRCGVTPEGARAIPGLCVLAMGKLGTRELNYFSDLDLIFCWDDDPSAPGGLDGTRATEIAEMTVETLTTVTRDGAPFTIDMRLRPEGASAPLCPPLSRYEHYYGARGQMWEFQSFMKIRPVAGDAALGEKFIRRCAAPIAERIAALGPDAIAQAMAEMRRKIEAGVKTPRWVLCDFKKGPGGLVDLDFLAQYWQLLYLDHEPELIGERPERVFERMAENGVLNAAEAESMRTDYRFLRRLESRARLLMNSDKTQAPGGGEKWESFARMACDLLPSSESDLRRYLLDTLRRNRARFDRYLSPSID